MRIFKYNKIINTSYAFEYGKYHLLGSRNPPEKGDIIEDGSKDYYLVGSSFHARNIQTKKVRYFSTKKRFGYRTQNVLFQNSGELVYLEDVKKVALVVGDYELCLRRFPCEKCERRYMCPCIDLSEENIYRRFLWGYSE